MTQGIVPFSSSNPAEIYEQFYIPAVFRHWTPFLLEFACPKPGEHVLDLACGTGIAARYASRSVGPHGRIVGLDYTFADEPEQFIESILKADALAIPVFRALDDKSRSELIEAVNRDLEPVLTHYTHNGRLIYLTAANIAVANA